jgi:hypothetical protein
VTRRAESPGSAREHNEPLLTTVRTPDPGEPAARVAAVEVAVDDFLDDRPEKTIFLLEAALILGQKPVEVMEKHPVEDSAFRMTGTIDSCHIRSSKSRNGPIPSGKDLVSGFLKPGFFSETA